MPAAACGSPVCDPGGPDPSQKIADLMESRFDTCFPLSLRGFSRRPSAVNGRLGDLFN
jgi:hypothetical protein